jgi:hypothetical protein
MQPAWQSAQCATQQTSPGGIFQFEQDFAGSLRCIPMAVRFKLDQCGVKLSLRQWSRFASAERSRLLGLGCEDVSAIEAFRRELERLLQLHSAQPAEYLAIEADPPWADASSVPAQLIQFAAASQVSPPSLKQWAGLSPLQRFTLLKLSRAKHDNVNFVPAMREFGILD